MKYKSSIVQYDVHWSDYVRKLKEKICKKEGVASGGMNIVCDGRWLNDDKQWWKTGVLDDDNHILVLSTR